MTLKINGATGGSVSIDAPDNTSPAGTDVTLTLPTSAGSSGQVLTTDGSGTLSFTTLASDSITEGNTTVECVDTGSNGHITFDTEGSEAARIDSSQRLLVGTSTARSNFFNTSVSALQQIEDLTSPRSAVISSSDVGGRGGALILAHQRSGTIGGNTVLNSGDNIGIVSFQGNDGSEFVIGASIEALVDGTPGANDMPGRLVFSTTADGSSSPTERMKIDNKGYLKATTDGAYTDIDPLTHGFRNSASGQYAITGIQSSANPNGLRIYYPTVINGNNNDFFYLHDSGALRARMKSNGGLVNYQSNDANLSDRNAKKDISPAADTWNCIKEWEIVNYRYKEQPDTDNLNIGVIAQQVAESCPEVITVFEEAEDDQPEKLGIKEQQMYWMAIKALQEAQTRIETLETANASLEARLTALEGGAS